MRDAEARDRARGDRVEIPVDAEARRLGRDRVAVRDREPRGRDVVELGDVLDPAPRSAPRRSATRGAPSGSAGRPATLKASARCATLSHGVMPPMRATVDLHDRAGAALAGTRGSGRVVERLADGDRDRRVRGELGRGRRGPRPAAAPRARRGRSGSNARARRIASDDVEALVGVDHDLEAVADRVAHRRQPRDVLGHVRLADLDLRAAEALRLRRQRVCSTSVSARQLQPAALGRVERHARLRAAGGPPQRQAGALRAQVPERGVDRRPARAR